MIAVTVDAIPGDLRVVAGTFLQACGQCLVARQATLPGHLLAGRVALGAVAQTCQVRMGSGEITR